MEREQRGLPARPGAVTRPRQPATQASIAVSADGRRWVLVNASPDLRQQIEAERLPASTRRPALVADRRRGADQRRRRRGGRPAASARGHAVRPLCASSGCCRCSTATRSSRWSTAASCRGARWRSRWLVALEDAAGESLGHGRHAVPRTRQGAALSRRRELTGSSTRRRWTATRWASSSRPAAGGWSISRTARGITEPLLERVAGADLLFLDGTLWRDDEMIAQGVGPKTGRRMGHISMSGPDGAIARLRGRPGRPPHLHPRQQHQPGPARRQRRARRARAGGLGSRL